MVEENGNFNETGSESFKIILSFIKWVFLGGLVGVLTGAV